MPSRSPRCLLALGLAAIGALVAAPAKASPEDVLGFGPRSIAMGATGAAGSEGYESVYGNPALLSTARSRQLTLGFVGQGRALVEVSVDDDGVALPVPSAAAGSATADSGGGVAPAHPDAAGSTRSASARSGATERA